MAYNLTLAGFWYIGIGNNIGMEIRIGIGLEIYTFVLAFAFGRLVLVLEIPYPILFLNLFFILAYSVWKHSITQRVNSSLNPLTNAIESSIHIKGPFLAATV